MSIKRLLFTWTLLCFLYVEISPKFQKFQAEIQVQYSSSLALSHNNWVLCIANLVGVNIFLNNGKAFQKFQTISQNAKLVTLTNDGDKMLIIDNGGNGFVYNFEKQYILRQYITAIDDDSETSSTEIAQNWIVIGKNNGNLYIYNNDESQYKFKEIINVREQIRSISYSSQYKVIAVGTSGKSIFIYQLNQKNNNFFMRQIIGFQNQAGRRVKLVNFYLTIAGGKDQTASIYKYKEEKGNYEEYKREKYEEKVKGVEISEEKDVMVVYFESRTMVETKINENNKDLSQKQVLSEGNEIISEQILSSDGKFLIIAKEKGVDIYKNNLFIFCDIPYCVECDEDNISNQSFCLDCNQFSKSYINTENGLCEQCNIVGCLQCQNLTDCFKCDEQNGYYLNYLEGKCERCQDEINCIINGCNISMNQFYNPENEQCQSCSEGCLDCRTSEFCEENSCDNEKDYFYDAQKYTCYSCLLKGCKDCLSHSICDVSGCDNGENYFYNHLSMQCDECSVDKCLKCESSYTCQEDGCNTRQNYFFDNKSRICVKCPLQGCSNCYNISLCIECASTQNYFSIVGKCQKCQVEHCLNCEGFMKCKQNGCDISLNYVYQDHSGLCALCTLMGCERCQKSDKCLQCSESYYLNGNRCLKCLLQGCKNNCTSSSTCSENGCDERYFDRNGTCINCELGCNRCDEQGCLGCAEDRNYFNHDEKCEKCKIVGCEKCKNLNQCLEDGCNSLMYKYNESSKACSLQCRYPCKQCQKYSNLCISCEERHFLRKGICIEAKLTGKGVIQVQEDKYAFCSMAGCSLCNITQDTCISCMSGFILSESECKPCIQNCQICVQRHDKCQQCFQGYFVKSNKCQKCGKNCEQCQDRKCLKCYEGSFLKGQSCISCEQISGNCFECSKQKCIQCKIGYSLTEENGCRKCIGNCDKCRQDVSECVSCRKGFYLKEDRCQKCLQNCEKCISDNICQECSYGYLLNENLKCSKICQFPCLQCQNKKCIRCYEGYKMNKQSQKCEEDLSCNENECEYCPLLYQRQNGRCLKCQSNCNCPLDSYKGDRKCEKCPKSCEICLTKNICLVCKQNYFMVKTKNSQISGQCSSCKKQFCEQCDYYEDQCKKCEGGYDLIGLECVTKKRIQFSLKTKKYQNLQQFKEDILERANYKKSQKQYIVYVSVKDDEENMNLVNGLVGIKKEEDPNQIFKRIQTSFKEKDKNKSSISLKRINFQKPSENTNGQPPPENNNHLVGAIIALSIFLLCFIIISCLLVMKCKQKNEGQAKEDEGKTESEETSKKKSKQKIKQPLSKQKSKRKMPAVSESPRKMLEQWFEKPT